MRLAPQACSSPLRLPWGSDRALLAPAEAPREDRIISLKVVFLKA
jgi:hypothetical protein